ncbi:multicopper oxidase domain-containing protein [Kineosporiaceae bacterium SCSIO 59966]|nr:multicopper oxidase domain-containing protein [Kineosporiaceae bacterium SCSIO 59966]
MSRAAWHLRTGAVVAAWLLALVVVALVHPFVPAARWLLVHLLVLGAVSNAILIWTWHFAAALLRLPTESLRRGQGLRLVLFNAGALGVVVGTVTGARVLVTAGAVVVAGVSGWHATALLRRARAALPSRFGVTVRYYVAAGLALPVGAVLGVLLGRPGLSDAGHGRLVVAHEVVNLLGWVGLTVVGTLVTLWPTMLRTRVADGAERAARRALPVLVGGVAAAAAAALAGSLVLAAVGVLVVLAGVVAVAVPHAEEVRRKAPVELPTASVLAGMLWLAGSLVVLAVGLATAGDWAVAGERAGALTAPLLAGFAAQVLLGALSYLVPVVLGGGPSVQRATSTLLGRSGWARLTAANAGLLLAVLPVPSLVRVVLSVVVLVALGSALPLLVGAVLLARRLRGAPPQPAGPQRHPTAQRRLGMAAAGLAVVLAGTAGGVALDPAAAGIPLTTASPAAGAAPAGETGRTTTVTVRVEGMRYVPDVVEVPAGDRLVVVLDNTGDDRHDLVLANGARSDRVGPEERTRLDAGVVTADLDGWCSVAGHRQMGMVLTVRAVGDLDVQADPGPAFDPYDPRLDPAPAGAVHEVTLLVREVEREVAPGVRQTLWTFGGTAPGPTLRGRIGDVFDVTLVNDGSIGHSIDFHAGALAPDRPMRTIQPGESLRYRFTATRAGIWMYHCSTAPMSLHIANGMFGAVVIDPPDLPQVDQEYVLVQSEYYLGPQGGVADADRVAAERPDLVVFNGYANQYDREPLTARVGERVRVWVLAAGPQRGSAFHVVGGQFDTVWSEGDYRLRPGPGGAQVLALAPAQGGFVELELPEPGRYPFVTHAMVDAERGAHGVLEVVP